MADVLVGALGSSSSSVSSCLGLPRPVRPPLPPAPRLRDLGGVLMSWFDTSESAVRRRRWARGLGEFDTSRRAWPDGRDCLGVDGSGTEEWRFDRRTVVEGASTSIALSLSSSERRSRISRRGSPSLVSLMSWMMWLKLAIIVIVRMLHTTFSLTTTTMSPNLMSALPVSLTETFTRGSL